MRRGEGRSKTTPAVHTLAVVLLEMENELPYHSIVHGIMILHAIYDIDASEIHGC